MKFKVVIREVIILIALLAGVILAFWFHKNKPSGNADIDRAVHMAMFVLYLKLFVWPVCLVLIIIIYGIKEAFGGYKRRFQNIILSTAVVLINAFLLLMARIISAFFAGKCGVTIYPPLSALPQQNVPVASCSGWDTLSILFYIQIFFLLLLVIIAILTGKNWNTKQRES